MDSVEETLLPLPGIQPRLSSLYLIATPTELQVKSIAEISEIHAASIFNVKVNVHVLVQQTIRWNYEG
jgi:hypothetical protein